MIEPWRAIVFGGATGAERSNETLGNDGTDLARSSGNTVRGGSVTGREAFSWHNEGGGAGGVLVAVLSTGYSITYFGPKLKKNWASTKQAKRPEVPMTWYPKPMMQKKMVKRMKPIS